MQLTEVRSLNFVFAWALAVITFLYRAITSASSPAKGALLNYQKNVAVDPLQLSCIGFMLGSADLADWLIQKGIWMKHDKHSMSYSTSAML